MIIDRLRWASNTGHLCGDDHGQAGNPAAQSLTCESRDMRKELWFAVALIAYATARLLPPLAGLAGPSQAALGVTLAGTILWISEAVPLGVTALLVIVLLAINPGMRLPDALAGFTSEVTFFLIGVAAIGTAVEASQLDHPPPRFPSPSAAGKPDRHSV